MPSTWTTTNLKNAINVSTTTLAAGTTDSEVLFLNGTMSGVQSIFIKVGSGETVSIWASNGNPETLLGSELIKIVDNITADYHAGFTGGVSALQIKGTISTNPVKVFFREKTT
jgi:hypothetical protein